MQRLENCVAMLRCCVHLRLERARAYTSPLSSEGLMMYLMGRAVCWRRLILSLFQMLLFRDHRGEMSLAAVPLQNIARMVVCGCTAAGGAKAVGACAGCHDCVHKLYMWRMLCESCCRQRQSARDGLVLIEYANNGHSDLLWAAALRKHDHSL